MSDETSVADYREQSEQFEVEKQYSAKQSIAKLRRLADCLEQDSPFEIMIDGKRVYVPARARFTIEYEVSEDEEELEFQFKWDA